MTNQFTASLTDLNRIMGNNPLYWAAAFVAVLMVCFILIRLNNVAPENLSMNDIGSDADGSDMFDL